MVHFEVPYDDAERAYAFYRDVFEWNLMPMPEMSYTGVMTGPVTDEGMPTEPGYIGGGMFQREEGSPVTAPVITLAVDDIEAALKKVGEHGGSTAAEPMKVGEMGFAADFRDPEGNLMGLWQSTS